MVSERLREESQSETNSVVCRPTREILIISTAIAGIWYLFLLMPLISGVRDWRDYLWMMAFLTPLSLACFLPALVYYMRRRVVADADGIRWRGIFGWRRAAWHEVSDYYLLYENLSRSSTCVPPLRVVTAHGMVSLPPDGSLSDAAAFQRYVAQHATAARTREWGLYRTRRIDDYPQTFRYWTAASPWNFLVGGIATLLCYSLLVGTILYALVDLTRQLGWQTMQPLFWGTILFCLVCTWVPLGVARMFFERWDQRGEQITVSPEDVRYENTRTNTVVHVPWSEVSDYFYGKPTKGNQHRYVLSLRGAGERQITWNDTLGSSGLLLRMVQEYAPRPGGVPADSHRWRAWSEHDRTGGSDPATWQSGAVGIGDRVFRYGGKNVTTLIWLGAVATAFFMVICLVDWWRTGSLPNGFALGAALLFALLTVHGVLCRLRCRIETDDLGIASYTLSGKKHLYWYIVADYHDKNGRLTVTGKNGERITVGGMYNGYNELKAEIQRLAPPPQTGGATPATNR